MINFIKNNYRYLIIFVFVFLVYYICTFPNSYGDPMANYGFSHAIVNGEIPYKDFNIISTPLYAFVMSTGLFVWNNYLMFVLEQTLLVTIMFVLLYKIYGKKSAIVLFIICLFGARGINPTYNFFVMFLLILLLFMEKKYPNKDFIIGVIIGLAIITKHTVGVLFILPSIIFYYKDIKRLMKRLLGCISVGVVFLLYLMFKGSFYFFLDLCIIGLFDFTSSNGHLFNMWFFVSIVTFIIGLFITIKNRHDISNYYLLCGISFVVPLFDNAHYSIYIICLILQIIPLIRFDEVYIEKLSFIFSLIAVYIYGLSCYQIFSPLLNHDIYRFQYFLNGKGNYQYSVKYYNFFDKYDNPLIISYSKMQYDISRNNYIDYFDVPLYGNCGYNGSNKMIGKIKKMHDKYIIVDMSAYSSTKYDSQFDKKIVKYVMDNYELVGSEYIFNVYYKK